jgi:hypothetical protein
MDTTIVGYLFGFSVLWAFLTWPIERRFSDSWKPWYYQWGVPIYRERYRPSQHPHRGAPPKENWSWQSTHVDQGLWFFRYGQFRHRTWGRWLEWSPLRGSMQHDPTSGTYRIVYFLNYHVVPLAVGFIALAVALSGQVGVLVGISLLIYLWWIVALAYEQLTQRL